MQPRVRGNRFALALVCLGILGGGAMTVSLAQAASGVGPFLPEQSWDRKLACSTIANCSRFLVLTNWDSAAVLDKETGLVWERTPDPNSAGDWSSAKLACVSRTTGNRKGWRLPSLHELASLVDPSTSALSLPLGHPFSVGVQKTDYWSATTMAENNTLMAWGLNLFNGFVLIQPRTFIGQVWCVRGANNADQY